MRTLFVNTFYWAAMLNPKDEWHQEVRRFNQGLEAIQLLTTDEVLIEFLNFFSGLEPVVKQGASQRVTTILQHPTVQVIAQSRQTLIAGLSLYQQRLDKGYSLTDCISMQTMKQLGVAEVLTHDRHFSQEGFTILFP